MISLVFHGAAGQVTGSATLVETVKHRILVDFGQFQGGRDLESQNRIPDGLDPANLDAILLTHGHLDHCGRLPLLARAGFQGEILATPATVEMAALILKDSAKIHESETARRNRRRERAGLEPVPPAFTAADVEEILKRFRPVPYNRAVPVIGPHRATFIEAGHMLGSASILLEAADGHGTRNLVFSGDIGPHNLPILQDPSCFHKADAIVLESTYGDRDHRSLPDTIDEFEGILREAIAEKSRVLVPAFAVGRTQQIIYHLVELFLAGRVEPFPIFIDSPMASRANRIYLKHPELFDEESHHVLRALASEPALRDCIRETESPEESRALNELAGPCLIIAGAGMAHAGRIIHHLRHGLWKPETRVIIVGYQAQGTLGRQLVERARKVRIFGEQIAVKARIHTLGGFSAHAGQSGLLEWLGCAVHDHPAVLLNHGEDKPRKALAKAVKSRFDLDARLPEAGERISL